MMFIAESFFGGCISKVINDGKDYSWTKIKSVINDRNDRNLSTRIYRVIEKALIKVTDKKFKGKDILYEAIEKIFIEFRDHGSTIEFVKCGLGMLNSNVTVERCENFLEKFYEGICQDGDLHEVIGLILQEKGIDINQKEFRQLNKTVEYGFDQLNRKVDKIDEKIIINKNEDILQNREPVKSRTQEYADKWEANMFLNDFDEWDENAGVNVKLSDVYIDEHLPHFIWGENVKESENLDALLSQYIIDRNENKILLILGQPGIGKSTLITWITVNFADMINDILVYRFASDLGNIDWNNGRISNRVLEELGLNHTDLNGKILILDGFDEVSIEANRRKDILDSLYGDWIYNKTIEDFSLIITCRENYVQEFANLKCKYITLQPWGEIQIKSFCDIFYEKTKDSISEATIEKLCENKGILGIPLILYMVLALNISIEKEGSIVDVYDKIFSLEGGIYDRCINNKNFEIKHRIGEVKEFIHQISREIAIWMFENEANKAIIPQEEYQKICRNIIQDTNKSKEIEQDFLIGNFFKLVKHCEGIETEELYFVHRTIYEYFVAETIYRSIENAMIELSIASQEELARNIAIYLKQGCVNYFIAEYLQYKILKLYSKLNEEKQKRFYQWWENAAYLMMENGMFYYTEKGVSFFKNIIAAECRCFLNLLEILRLLMCIDNRKYIMENAKGELVEKYIKCCCIEYKRFSNDKIMDLSKMFLQKVNLKGIQLKGICLNQVNLERTDLVNADLSKLALLKADLAYADLRGANLEDAALMEADLRGADLTRANLYGAKLDAAKLVGVDLKKADLRGVDLTGAYMKGIFLDGALIDDYQVPDFEKKLNLHGVKIFINKTQKIVSYDEYCESK